jgi:bla regulator protein BlaR1
MNTMISADVIQALGWTLLHSLWQGALLAFALLLILPRLAAANRRYWASFIALAVLPAAAVLTFIQVYEPAPALVLPVLAESTPTFSIVLNTQTTQTDAWGAVSAWLEAWHPMIVRVWLAGFAFFILRMVTGLLYVRRLRSSGVRLENAVFQRQLGYLASRLHLTRPIELLESALVHTPMMMGYFKPVILFPLGLVNRLSPAEVEAILTHELAHIARRDWLFNLIQAFIEAVFYYHPAVWWISGIVRTERENCCDDIAVSMAGNRMLYAKTLVQVQEWAKKAAAPQLALAIHGSTSLLRPRPMLLERIRRVLNQPQPKSHMMEKLIATGILLALLTFCGLKANTVPGLSDAFQKLAAMPAAFLGAQVPDMDSDSLPKPKKSTQKITQDDGNRRVELELENGQITRLNIDGQEIPEAEFEEHSDLMDELLLESSAPPPPPALFYKDGVWGYGDPARLSTTSAAEAPAFPAFPAPPATITGTVLTEKDAEGNTIIILNRDGKDVEIKIKDAEVYIDGAKMAKGQSFQIDSPTAPRAPYPAIGQQELIELQQLGLLAPQRLEINGELMEFPAMPELPAIYYEGYRYEGLDEARLAQLEAERAAVGRLSKKDRKKMDKEIERMRKEMAEARESSMEERNELLQERREELLRAREEMLRANEETRQAMEEARRAMEASRRALAESRRYQNEVLREGRNATQARIDGVRAGMEMSNTKIKESLLSDRLITNSKHFTFELDNTTLTVNGKKQSPEMHQKYKKMYEDLYGREMTAQSKITISEDNKD